MSRSSLALFLFFLFVQLSSQAQSYRHLFKHWIDADGNCLDTREEILKKYSSPQAEIDKCKVSSGKWLDPYSGKIINFPQEIDVDHIVPINEAAKSGALKWSPQKRQDFANDYENLLPTKNSLNRQKSDKGPDQWLPPLASYQCLYVRKYQKIKVNYDLQSNAEEYNFIKSFLKKC